MNKFSRLVSGLLALLGVSKSTTSAPVAITLAPKAITPTPIPAGILRLAAQNKRYRMRIVELEERAEAFEMFATHLDRDCTKLKASVERHKLQADNMAMSANNWAKVAHELGIENDELQTAKVILGLKADYLERKVIRKNQQLSLVNRRLAKARRRLADASFSKLAIKPEIKDEGSDQSRLIGYKDVRSDDYLAWYHASNKLDLGYWNPRFTVSDYDEDSEVLEAPRYGFAAMKTARYHCRGCRRMEKQRGHRCGKK